MTINERLREAIEDSGYTYRELGDLTGISPASIHRYTTKATEYLPLDRLKSLSKALHVNPLWIMGIDDQKTPRTGSVVGLKPINEQKKVPVLGRIACGTPITAEQNIERYEYTDDESIDYALDAVGDSMIDAGIHDGDVVYIHAQEQVENGEIGAVIVDGEATLKRIYYNGTVITLVPCNDKYSPVSYRQGQADIRIVGKAIQLRRTL